MQQQATGSTDPRTAARTEDEVELWPDEVEADGSVAQNAPE